MFKWGRKYRFDSFQVKVGFIHECKHKSDLSVMLGAGILSLRSQSQLEAEGRTNSTSETRAPGLKSEAILPRVMNTARVFLVISLLLVADNVRSRTVYVINNRGYNYLDGELNYNKRANEERSSLIDDG